MITSETRMIDLSDILDDYDLDLRSVKFNPKEPPAERCTVRLVGKSDGAIFIGEGPAFVEAINDALHDVEELGHVDA